MIGHPTPLFGARKAPIPKENGHEARPSRLDAERPLLHCTGVKGGRDFNSMHCAQANINDFEFKRAVWDGVRAQGLGLKSVPGFRPKIGGRPPATHSAVAGGRPPICVRILAPKTFPLFAGGGCGFVCVASP